MTDSTLKAVSTTIPGLILFELPVHGDNRGWFKENWQREKMMAIGLPDFGPVQNNISFNESVGTTRGIHAEPWDKLVSVASGRVFCAWVDLREGESFGAVFTAELGPSRAVFVPYGVGNSYQTLEAETAYSYLVNDHWSPTASYTFLNLADETAAVQWPIPLDRAELSEKDRTHPRLDSVVPMRPRKTAIFGADGQLGRALRRAFPAADHFSHGDFDVTDESAYSSIHWRSYDTIINATAFTDVDGAERPDGRRSAWRVNVSGVALLARTAAENGVTLVHISSDYVFDGTLAEHDEHEPVSPLGVYGQTKAAADSIVQTVPRHYIVRTSWVIGDGRNFVRTMESLARRGVKPSVVNDQVGRLTFTDELSAGIAHLVASKAPFGTYNLSNGGEPQSWAQIAKRIYDLVGGDSADVSEVSTLEYTAGKSTAPRPPNSVLSLDKIVASGFVPRDADDALIAYVRSQPDNSC